MVASRTAMIEAEPTRSPPPAILASTIEDARIPQGAAERKAALNVKT
jgi:hypothetical protein